jgi:hypothetical protein
VLYFLGVSTTCIECIEKNGPKTLLAIFGLSVTLHDMIYLLDDNVTRCAHDLDRCVL